MFRSLNIWGPGYLKASLHRMLVSSSGPLHLILTIADHFEPLRGDRTPAAAATLVRDWLLAYRKAFAGFRDSTGQPPRHTFFYPGDAYERGCVAALAEFCAEGWGETEVHLHHRHDTSESLTDRLCEFRDTLHRDHGLLGCDRTGKVRFGFVHGNWALCNSRPDGDWCGVAAELSVLCRAGCYADFTFPSAPSPTQPRTVNTLYRASDKPDGRPRGHDYGPKVRAGGALPEAGSDALLMIPGPLDLDWRRRKWGLLPRIDNAELSGANPPDPRRITNWLKPRIHVPGRPEWVFVKLHTHGCVPANRDAVLGAAMQNLHRALADGFKQDNRCLHYVTAREMANLVLAAENGAEGDPDPWRDYVVAPPPVGKVYVQERASG